MYSVTAGDTFELISRKQYGTELYASNIARANPGAAEPLTVGTQLVIPAIPGAAPARSVPSQAPSNNPEEVALLIDGTRYRFWETISVTRSIDTVDSVSFTAPFDADSAEFRNTFRPFSYRKVEVTAGGALLFTGTMVDILPAIGPEGKKITVTCYATPGVLNDCTPPASAYPVEYNQVDLRDVCKQIVQPFGVTVDFKTSPGPAFERVASEPGESVLGFLSTLAKQRNLVMSSSPDGKLVFQQSIDSGQPVAMLRQGESPLISVTPSFNPQEYYSHITGLEPVVIGRDGSQYTVKNPHLPGALRPAVFQPVDCEAGSVKTAVESKMGRMFGNVVAYTVKVDTWRDAAGNLWDPNTIVSIQAKNAMIYSDYKMVVRSVSFQRVRDNFTVTLTLVLPGSFSGQIPETLPWD